MPLRWPWKQAAAERLVVAAAADHLVYLGADAQGRVTHCGAEQRGSDTPAEFTRRQKALGLPAGQVTAVLPLAETQLIQIEAPAVKPEEMKAAARWRVKDKVQGRLDELTLDVMVVGGDEPRPQQQLFVAAARTEAIRATAMRLQAAGLAPSVVDITETAQRNLQSALAEAEGLGGRATAALVRHGDLVLLTISAGGELYVARRLEWDAARPAAPTPAPAALARNTAPAPLSFEDADIVDYGAEPEAGSLAMPALAYAPRMVVELQRSFDLWERSWPDLPLAALWTGLGDETDDLHALMEATFGLPIGAFDPARVLPGWQPLAVDSPLQQTALGIAGALLRTEPLRA